MTTLTTDTIQVWTSDTGAPTRFVYAGRRWLVTGRPQRWMTRLPWWQTVARIPAETPVSALEQTVWQVDAVATDNDDTLHLQLAYDRDARAWHPLDQE